MKKKGILYFLFLFFLKANAQVDTTAIQTTIIDSVVQETTPQESLTTTKYPVTSKTTVPMYHMNKWVEYPLTAVLGGTTVYLFTIIYSKSPTPEAEILALNKNDIPAIDRWSAGFHDENLDKISYIPFYAVMPLPLLFYADKKIKKEMGTVIPLYLESFAINGIIYSSSVYFVDRFRPEVYNTDLPMSYRTNGNFRNSFFAGHVGVVANATFFMSSVYMAYHPGSKAKWWLYGGSTVATLGMAYLRLESGKHFTTDIIVGTAVGVGCGLLVPAFHKNKEYKHQKWSVAPTIINNEQPGFSFVYHLR